MKRLIVFGTGKISECVSYYFERERKYKIEAFCCDRSFLLHHTFNGRPVVAKDLSLFTSNEIPRRSKWALLAEVSSHPVFASFMCFHVWKIPSYIFQLIVVYLAFVPDVLYTK